MKTHGKLSALPLGSVHARGWIREQLERSKNGMGGHLDELEPDMIANPYINCGTDEKWGAVKAGWGAEISGNFWYGFMMLAFGLDDGELKAKAARWVEGVMKNQRADGYMGTYTDSDNVMDDYNAWGTNCGMKAMLAYYEATGRKDVLEAVHRCMLWFCDVWKGDKKTLYAGQTLVESMAVCYLHTGDARLLGFIHDYIDFIDRNDLYLISRSAMLSPELVYNSEHSAGFASHLWVYASAYKADGDPRNLGAAENAVRKIEKKALGFNGGIPSQSEYLGPVFSTVETEYCTYAFFESALIQTAEASGDPKYIDLVERILFNGAQGARKKDEKAIAYMTSANQLFAREDSSLLHGDMAQYAPVYPTSCCPVTSCWVVPDYLRSMAMTDGEELYFTAYGPAEIDCGGFAVTEETEYPFGETVRFRVSAGRPIRKTLHFRIPGWCEGASLAVNGEKGKTDAEAGTYVPVAREWKDGDTVTLELPMKVRVRRLDDGDMCARYPIAFEYGPLLFALKVPEVWKPVPGKPRTPLPEGWSWWDLEPKTVWDDRGDIYEQHGLRRFNITWNVAVDETIRPEDVKVERTDGEGYVWEDPRIRLRLPAYKALYAFAPYPRHSLELYSGPIDVYGESFEIELVPYGCTNLRITYLPRAKLPARPMPKAGRG
ncbi:MAG: glycoside hydrolase family 127 protein [Clostridia bacterium]|nr:glycoside hydrolase family 127 protein [Clostridia bacterium]